MEGGRRKGGLGKVDRKHDWHQIVGSGEWRAGKGGWHQMEGGGEEVGREWWWHQMVSQPTGL